MKEYFYPEQMPTNQYLVKLHNELVPNFHHEGGSLILIQSGILDMSYSNYLRMCRDVYGGELIGKNSGYPGVKFKKKEDALRLCALLNPVMDMYVKYREKINVI